MSEWPKAIDISRPTQYCDIPGCRAGHDILLCDAHFEEARRNAAIAEACEGLEEAVERFADLIGWHMDNGTCRRDEETDAVLAETRAALTAVREARGPK